MGKIGVDPRRDKPKQSKPCKHAKGDGHVPPIRAKCARQILGEEFADEADALALGTIDLAVRANDEAVEIVDELWVTRLSPSDGEIGCCPAVTLAEFAHLHLRQPAQAGAAEHRQQVLKPPPVVLVLVEKAIHDKNGKLKFEN